MAPGDLADRPPEDWEQLLGLDGSFKFLKPLFCVMFMNALFIMVFLYLPRLMGNLGIAAVSLQDEIAATHFEGLIATIGGYCLISMCLSVVHTFATSIGLGGAKRYIGLGFIIVKVRFSWLPVNRKTIDMSILILIFNCS